MDETYPFLQSLVHGYFHQDFDAVFDSFDEAFDGYAKTHDQDDRNGLRADILRFLANNPGNTFAHFTNEFRPDLEMAENDSEIKIWLERAIHIACVH
jgi:CdiI immunity protein